MSAVLHYTLYSPTISILKETQGTQFVLWHHQSHCKTFDISVITKCSRLLKPLWGGEKDKSLASAATDECGSRFPNVEALWRAAGDVVPLFRTLFHKSFTKSQQSILRSPDLTALREDELTSYTLRIKREFGRYWATVLIPTWHQMGQFRKSGFYFFCSLWWLVFQVVLHLLFSHLNFTTNFPNSKKSVTTAGQDGHRCCPSPYSEHNFSLHSFKSA